jgi:hypothetical protein
MEEECLTYRVPDTESLGSWADETFTVYDEGIRSDDVVATLGPSKYTTGHFFLGERRFLLHAAHWRTDGYGALQLVNSFLDNLCNSIGYGEQAWRFGDEVQRLTPSIEEILDLPVTPTQDIVNATKNCIKTLGYAKGAVGVGPQDKEGGNGPKGTRSTRFRLAEADTKAVQEACAAHNISLLSAVHASCASLTYLEATPDDQDKHYTSTMRFSLRPHLQKPHCAADSAAGLYTGGYMFRVPASQSWMENARQYQHEYDTGITVDFLKCRRHYATEVLGILQQNLPPPDPPPSEIDISSVGNAEELVSPQHRHGKTVLEVRDVSIGVETLTRQIYCFLWTYRSRLEFQLVYNEAYYSAERMEKMVKKLPKILMTELELLQC